MADPDAQHALSCRVTATNIAGGTFATSAARDIAAIAPQNAAQPSRLRQRAARLVVQLRDGIVERLPRPGALRAVAARQLVIGGAESAAYAITPADAGHRSPAA